MAKIKKPKKLKLPKRPKASASIAVMENYLRKVAEVKKENARRLSQYERDKKRLVTLRNQIARTK